MKSDYEELYQTYHLKFDFQPIVVCFNSKDDIQPKLKFNKNRSFLKFLTWPILHLNLQLKFFISS